MAEEAVMATIEEIAKCAQHGQLEDWIDAFLRGEGKNVVLADGLNKQQRYWIGPIRFPLRTLVRCCGPEEGMEFRESTEVWNERIDSLVDHMKSGGELAPFIVQYANGNFSIRDGNHRYGACERLGLANHWTLIWCDSEEDFEEMKHTIEAGHRGWRTAGSGAVGGANGVSENDRDPSTGSTRSPQASSG